MLQRSFKNQPAGTAFSQQIKTVEPITVASSSITAGQQVLDKPNELTVTLNRPAKTLQDVKLVRLAGDKEELLPTTTELRDTALTIRFGQPLPRSADLRLRIASLGAADGGYLASPFSLDFKTSGGPKVVGINIGSYAVSSLPAINLRLDSALAAGQNLADSARLEVGGKAVPAVVTGSGTTLSLRPQSAFGPCTTFVVKVLDSLQNLHGVAGGSAWQYQSRTTCQIVSSIGTSAQGRAIAAYRFGSGASHMLFVGATHGDERSSAAILNSWINYLEANPGVIPASRSITIIPVVNPDGYAANKRTNANNVDLNRNFPAYNWKQSVTMPDKSTNPNGGGSSPLSEPESRALANYTQSLSPRLVLTYHATGNVAVPNLTGDSNDLAWKYARNSSVYYLNPSSTASFFEYDTTGAYEDWLHDKAGIPALLIELNTTTGNEFNSHLPALKIMAGS
jgi:protein MpaA